MMPMNDWELQDEVQEHLEWGIVEYRHTFNDTVTLDRVRAYMSAELWNVVYQRLDRHSLFGIHVGRLQLLDHYLEDVAGPDGVIRSSAGYAVYGCNVYIPPQEQT